MEFFLLTFDRYVSLLLEDGVSAFIVVGFFFQMTLFFLRTLAWIEVREGNFDLAEEVFFPFTMGQIFLDGIPMK